MYLCIKTRVASEFEVHKKQVSIREDTLGFVRDFVPFSGINVASGRNET